MLFLSQPMNHIIILDLGDALQTLRYYREVAHCYLSDEYTLTSPSPEDFGWFHTAFNFSLDALLPMEELIYRSPYLPFIYNL